MIKFFYFFLVLLITSCSGSLNDTICHINGDKDYLNTDPLYKIVAPSDLKLPVANDEYEIPSVVVERGSLDIEKKVNICPPSVAY